MACEAFDLLKKLQQDTFCWISWDVCGTICSSDKNGLGPYYNRTQITIKALYVVPEPGLELGLGHRI